MWRPARLSLIIRATGLSFTKAVRTFTGIPRKAGTLATLVSAEVTWTLKVSEQWKGCPSAGVRRRPMLEGTSMAYLASSRKEMDIGGKWFGGVGEKEKGAWEASDQVKLRFRAQRPRAGLLM